VRILSTMFGGNNCFVTYSLVGIQIALLHGVFLTIIDARCLRAGDKIYAMALVLVRQPGWIIRCKVDEENLCTTAEKLGRHAEHRRISALNSHRSCQLDD